MFLIFILSFVPLIFAQPKTFTYSSWVSTVSYNQANCKVPITYVISSVGLCVPAKVTTPCGFMFLFLPKTLYSGWGAISLTGPVDGDYIATRYNYTDAACSRLSPILPNPQTQVVPKGSVVSSCEPLGTLPPSPSPGPGPSPSPGPGPTSIIPMSVASFEYSLQTDAAIPTPPFIGMTSTHTLSPTCKDDTKIVTIYGSNPITMCYWPSLPGLTNSYTVLCDGPNSSPQLYQFSKLQCQGTSTAVSDPASVPTIIAQGFYVLTSEAFRNKCFYDAMLGIYQYSGICSNGLSSGGNPGGGNSNGGNKGNSNEGMTSTAQTGVGVGVGVGVVVFVLLSASAGYWYYYIYRKGKGAKTTGGLAAQDEAATAAAAAAATSSHRGQENFVSDTIPLPRTSLARESDGNSFQQPPSRLVGANMQVSDEI